MAFAQLMDTIKTEVISYLFRASGEILHSKLSGYAGGREYKPEAGLPQTERQQLAASAGGQPGATAVKQRIVDKKTGRNEPCPCGSGKKYKYCCGR